MDWAMQLELAEESFDTIVYVSDAPGDQLQLARGSASAVICKTLESSCPAMTYGLVASCPSHQKPTGVLDRLVDYKFNMKPS